VTLIEMLVTVAILVIMMTILVQIFQSATGAVTGAQQFQQIDDQLRRIDSVIRGDLEGVTAKFTPPLNPALNLGYFEYGENEFADNQGEDSDDYIRFTAKAPPDRPFTGRMFVPPSLEMINGLSAAQLQTYEQSQPVTVTSDYAEIIYFLRNGNLYRRVLLVNPDLQAASLPGVIVPAISYGNGSATYNQGVLPTANGNGSQFALRSSFGTGVSWQGLNDLSARPNATGPNGNASQTLMSQASQTIVLNSLGDLTNRENRFAYSRFANDFYDVNTGSFNKPDGLPDDLNGDNAPDLYPSLYPNVFNTGLINAPNYQGNATAIGLLAFPYIFPGAYSKAQALSNDAYGWIHSPSPYANANGTAVQFDTSGLAYVNNLNHNPLDLGDNLPTPANPAITAGGKTEQNFLQTWWGFPTWRETLSPNWVDPTVQVNVGGAILQNGNATPAQPIGLNPLLATEVNSGTLSNAAGTRLLLPAMDSTWRVTPQLFTDSWGDNGNNLFTVNPTLWNLGWEDDLIMTNVRSFDVKAYDNALANYADLGWGDDLRMYQPYSSVAGALNPATPPYIAGNNGSFITVSGTPTPVIAWPPINTNVNTNTTVSNLFQTFAHEGRIPPLTNDLVFDAQYGVATNYLPSGSGFLVANKGTYNDGNVGDNSNGVVRLRRVWDSWSTEYSQAPGTGVGPAVTGSFPVGPPWSPPIYPSYPPPYPAPLRGIQIQIRVNDPSSQRIKSLTIREDFTDKL
jgi:type II secretory pathway pseudopilin PulG